METYRYSICEPFNPEIIEKGEISREEIVETFEQFPWEEYLRQMEDRKDDKLYYSPSLEFENLSAKHGISFSVVGDTHKSVFYIFYKRPATVKFLFGLIKKEVQNHMTQTLDQSKEDALKILKAFVSNDYTYLDQVIV